MSKINLKLIISIVSKHIKVAEKDININSKSNDFYRWDSLAQVNIILEIEKNVKHDVIAFLTSITEKSGKEARYLHKGMTSSDVLDTCFNLQLKQSAEILLKDLDLVLASLKKQALKHKYTMCIGRRVRPGYN